MKNFLSNIGTLITVFISMAIVPIFIYFARITKTTETTATNGVQDKAYPIAIIPKSNAGCTNVLVDMGNSKFMQCGHTTTSMTIANIEYLVCDCVDGN